MLKNVATPSLPEDTKQHPARELRARHPKTYTNVHGVHAHSRAEAVIHQVSMLKELRSLQILVSEVRGELAPHAASILMKLLYAARIARFDLLRSINNLARNITKWSSKDDARLHHLLCYVQSSKSKKMVGRVGDDLSKLSIDIYADADFAGCEDSLRSTSGCSPW